MMGADLSLFVAAVFGLLVTPGPTNTLLMTAGASAGFKRAITLIPYELAAYILSIGMMTTLLRPILEGHQTVVQCIKIAAALYLLRSAFYFWRGQKDSVRFVAISSGQVFVTTLLNPKAFIFAFVIFPNDELLRAFCLFALISISVACGWILMGHSLAHVGKTRAAPQHIYRLASVAHVLFAGLLLHSVVLFANR
jgi:threonine/homoserine/homoserine lactone efflux protein